MFLLLSCFATNLTWKSRDDQFSIIVRLMPWWMNKNSSSWVCHGSADFNCGRLGSEKNEEKRKTVEAFFTVTHWSEFSLISLLINGIFLGRLYTCQGRQRHISHNCTSGSGSLSWTRFRFSIFHFPCISVYFLKKKINKLKERAMVFRAASVICDCNCNKGKCDSLSHSLSVICKFWIAYRKCSCDFLLQHRLRKLDGLSHSEDMEKVDGGRKSRGHRLYRGFCLSVVCILHFCPWVWPIHPSWKRKSSHCVHEARLGLPQKRRK